MDVCVKHGAGLGIHKKLIATVFTPVATETQLFGTLTEDLLAGKSGTRILQALAAGETDPEVLAGGTPSRSGPGF